MNPHPINPSDIRSISLHGCGGTGTHVAAGLARLELAIKALGGEFPDVTLCDPDIVEEPNVGRQLYTHEDIGINKATALCQRINFGYGLGWKTSERDNPGCLALICVDSRRARKGIYPGKKRTPLKSGAYRDSPYGSGSYYYLDFGNEASTGQVVFGGRTLPTPAELYPELTDLRIKESNTPSCSLAEALESQELFVNMAVATYGLQLLWSIFRRGTITNRGHFINLNGSAIPISLPPIKSRNRK